MQINQANLTQLTRGFRVVYEKALQSADPIYKRFVMVVPSTGKDELYAWLGAISGMRELLDEVQIQNLSASTWTIRNKEWENTIAVKELDIVTDKLGVYNPLFASLGDVAAYHPDQLTSTLLTGGFTNLCYTGKNFFDANHAPVAGGTTFTNKHTYKLSGPSYTDALANFKSRLNAKGRPVGIGRKLILVVSPQNESVGKQILQSDFILQTAMNVARTENVAAASVPNVNKGTAELAVWTELAANPNMWFILEVGFITRPILFQQHTAPRLISVNQPNDSYVVLKHEFLYQAYGIYNAGYGFPEFAEGSTGATAAL